MFSLSYERINGFKNVVTHIAKQAFCFQKIAQTGNVTWVIQTLKSKMKVMFLKKK